MHRGRGTRSSRGSGGGRGQKRTPAPSTASLDEFADDSSSFFSDLTGVRAPRAKSATSTSVSTTTVAADASPVSRGRLQQLAGQTGLSSAIPGGSSVELSAEVEGSHQTQSRVLWLELGLCKALIRAVSHIGYLAPTPVQAEAIPAILSAADVCARAVTGSGKTAAFLLPLSHLLLTRPPQKSTAMGSKRRFIRAVVVLPTRELGVQCQSMLQQLLQFTTGLTVALAIGGVAPAAQEAALDAVPDILIATPGRLVDYLHNYKGGAGLDLTGVEVLVLDECDKLLTITLVDQILDIMQHIPAETRQVLMLSATMTQEVDEFAKEQLFQPKNIDIGHVALQSQLRQQFVRIRTTAAPSGAAGNATAATAGDDEAADPKKKRVRSKRLREEARAKEAAAAPPPADTEQEHIAKIKTRHLVALCRNYIKEKTIIFCRYRTTAHRLAMIFNALQLPAVEIQGSQLQGERFAAFEQFAEGAVGYLITTDVASRGLDIDGVATVINYDMPPTLTAYIHRVGRTARIGTAGTAVSLVHEVEDAEIMRKILAVSGAVNEHQVASVKRRDVPVAMLQSATAEIDAVFPQIRALLTAEQLEAQIATAEKRHGGGDFIDGVSAKATKTWCLSPAERHRRDEAARQAYEKEAELTMHHYQNELAHLERAETDILRRQKKVRRVEREQKDRQQQKVKDRARELRKKSEKKVQAGVVKKLKKKKVREAAKERRAAAREKQGAAPYRHGDGRQRNKKSRHRKRVKRH